MDPIGYVDDTTASLVIGDATYICWKRHNQLILHFIIVAMFGLVVWDEMEWYMVECISSYSITSPDFYSPQIGRYGMEPILQNLK